MEEGADLRKAKRVLRHLSKLHKSYNKVKMKKGRDLLPVETLQGSSSSVDSVNKFLHDPKVVELFTTTGKDILRGHRNKQRYDLGLGLMAAWLVYR